MDHGRPQPVALLLAAFAVCAAGGWFYLKAKPQAPEITRPPLDITVEVERLRVWGAWEVQAGYVPAGTGAIEIRCWREASLCVEAEANLLQHTEGEDLSAEVRLYRITTWGHERVEAGQVTSDADCVRGTLDIEPKRQSARRSWQGIGECGAASGVRSWLETSCSLRSGIDSLIAAWFTKQRKMLPAGLDISTRGRISTSPDLHICHS